MNRRGPRNRVRIVGGQWRSRVLRFPDLPGLRPTPDRVRETLFNWLGQDLTGRVCLDLFAGSGVLGLEAASRGAREVVMVERDPQALRALQDNVRMLQAAAVRLVRADALEFIKLDTRTYDVVFLDPPYAMGGRELLLERVRGRVAPGGMVYVEGPEDVLAPTGWALHRAARAGVVHYQLLTAVS
ncbi:MAG TPA: 16S rRNA (guanine(966)-N(2))-methyltransferase RsmD [Burkholderiales bacterium]